MYEVAKKERSEIFTSVFLLLPAITALLIVSILCSYRSIYNLNDKGFFDLIVEFELDINKMYPQMSMLGRKFWYEFERGYLFISASSGTAIIFLIRRGNFNNLKTRIKEVNKYLPDKGLSILRFNR